MNDLVVESKLVAEFQEKYGTHNSIIIKFHKGNSNVRWIFDEESGILIIISNKFTIGVE
ncbi:hypothetical protein SDC9_200682 [bioreactor metagenome]|uniref:Uncharacterized protein n=1 Tax=bioreactor metagenome TaxID=1076179 RepID=A0A645IRN1_9ZZZZ